MPGSGPESCKRSVNSPQSLASGAALDAHIAAAESPFRAGADTPSAGENSLQDLGGLSIPIVDGPLTGQNLQTGPVSEEAARMLAAGNAGFVDQQRRSESRE